MVEPGLYRLVLRAKPGPPDPTATTVDTQFVRLADVPPPPGYGSQIVFLFTREQVRELLADLGADGEQFIRSLPEGLWLTEREVIMTTRPVWEWPWIKAERERKRRPHLGPEPDALSALD